MKGGWHEADKGNLMDPGLHFPGAGGGTGERGDTRKVVVVWGRRHKQGQAEGVRGTNRRLGLRLDYLSASSPN